MFNISHHDQFPPLNDQKATMLSETNAKKYEVEI